VIRGCGSVSSVFHGLLLCAAAEMGWVKKEGPPLGGGPFGDPVLVCA
jgi:hypothetical protein